MSAELTLLEALTARLLQHEAGGVRRLSVEVEREQVTFWLREGQLRASCTCALERCAHLFTAASFVCDAPLTTPAELRARSSLRPPPSALELRALPEAFAQLCLATSRAGIAQPDSPSIKQAIEQLLEAAPKPMSLSLARWIARFQEALSAGEAGEVARLLAGALSWADELRAPAASVETEARRRAWLGGSDGLGGASLADVTLIEVAREWLSAGERGTLERRYLIDLAEGGSYVEERLRGEGEASVGPCPRNVHVAFAELDTATCPQRVRLLQYTLSLPLSEAPWQRLVSLAQTTVDGVREQYVRSLRAAPGLAEPFALFAPAEHGDPGRGTLRDRSGDQLALAAHNGLPGLESLLSVVRGAELVCVLGRLLARSSGGLALQPLSAIVRRGVWLELRRVT